MFPLCSDWAAAADCICRTPWNSKTWVRFCRELRISETSAEQVGKRRMETASALCIVLIGPRSVFSSYSFPKRSHGQFFKVRHSGGRLQSKQFQDIYISFNIDIHGLSTVERFGIYGYNYRLASFPLEAYHFCFVHFKALLLI